MQQARFERLERLLGGLGVDGCLSGRSRGGAGVAIQREDFKKRWPTRRLALRTPIGLQPSKALRAGWTARRSHHFFYIMVSDAIAEALEAVGATGLFFRSVYAIMPDKRQVKLRWKEMCAEKTLPPMSPRTTGLPRRGHHRLQLAAHPRGGRGQVAPPRRSTERAENARRRGALQLAAVSGRVISDREGSTATRRRIPAVEPISRRPDIRQDWT